jgi:hypothetical protein
MTNLTTMTLNTMLKTARMTTLEAWIADVERMCGKDGVTATEARYLVGKERERRSKAGLTY